MKKRTIKFMVVGSIAIIACAFAGIKIMDYMNDRYVGTTYYVMITEKDIPKETRYEYTYYVDGYTKDGEKKSIDINLNFYDEEEKSKILLYEPGTYLEVDYSSIELDKKVVSEQDIPVKALQEIQK